MSAKKLKELRKIMNSHLCNRCGSCVGLSKGAIEFVDREGKFRPKIVGGLSPETIDRIYTACGGKYFNFKFYTKEFYSDTKNFHTYIGPYKRLGIGYTTNAEFRLNGASGGIITTTLIYLLEKNLIDGAVTTRMSHVKPWLAETIIATTKEELLESAQSKYCITSVNEILDKIEAFKGNLAYVGLPPQVQSIRKLQHIKDPSVESIKYIFGPFYGNTLHFSSVRSLMRTYGEKDYTQINKLYFRHGEWPGNMRIELKNGRIIELKKFHANYLIPFHILRNSLFCTDLANEFTDISGGDAWAPAYEERGKGFSLVISRSKTGEDLLQEMLKEGWLEFDQISEEEAITMHSHGYDLKKRGAFIRIKFRKIFGKSIPDYGYVLKDFPISRYLMEVIISLMFLLLSNSLARWIIEQFSPTFIGGIFENARLFWKKSTFSIKRAKLN